MTDDPRNPTGSGRPDRVDEAAEDSFPASDPPAFNPGEAKPVAAADTPERIPAPPSGRFRRRARAGGIVILLGLLLLVVILVLT